MPLTFRDIDFTVELPDIPSHAPVLSHTPPCVKDRDDTTRALAEILEIDVVGTASVPHGYAVGSDRGQVEVFSASGAVRARNTERLAAYPDERRKWSEVERDETGTFTLGGDLTREVAGHGLELLRRVGLADEHAAIDVSLGQWAELAEDGTEVDSGPGRATVRLSYAAEGLALLGPGAKTNLHFDPNDDGRSVTLATAYGLGLGLPFILIAAGLDRAGRASGWLRRHQRTIQVVGGVMLVLVGLLMVTGMWGDLNTWIQSELVNGFEVAV